MLITMELLWRFSFPLNNLGSSTLWWRVVVEEDPTACPQL
uniref:Uncharacterized protein n=1 Tax=Arundo donax TaxID=35708 RepID=A0A0A9FKV9_ARUDO